jgi:hypothetical protein
MFGKTESFFHSGFHALLTVSKRHPLPFRQLRKAKNSNKIAVFSAVCAWAILARALLFVSA